MSTRKGCPPTPFYLGKRADLLARQAELALSRHNREGADRLLEKSRAYRERAGQLQMEMEITSCNP